MINTDWKENRFYLKELNIKNAKNKRKEYNVDFYQG